jgi:PqqD family protein of HPr-rel-A system
MPDRVVFDVIPLGPFLVRKESDWDTSWRLTIDQSLPVRYWDGDCIVHNPLSGDTHILDVVSGEVIARLMVGPVRWSVLCQGVADFLEVPNDARLAAKVNEIVSHLDEIGLVEPTMTC